MALIDQYFRKLIELGGSDLHITQNQPPKIRVHGSITPISDEILTGVLTNQCVGATCKDAMFRDFKPIVVEEATGTATPHLHEPAIEMMNMGWGQVNTLEQTLAELREFPLVEGSAS